MNESHAERKTLSFGYGLASLLWSDHLYIFFLLIWVLCPPQKVIEN